MIGQGKEPSAIPLLNPSQPKLICIITKSDIRYEGTLYLINAQEQSIALSNVRSYGTEGRKPQNEILPSNVLYQYIVFKSSDIKDIMVKECSNKDNNNPTPTEQQQTTTQTTQIVAKEEENKKKPQEKIEKPIEKQENKTTNIENKKDKDDLDFDLLNAKFQKLSNSLDPTQKKEKSYTKENFFDNISNTITEIPSETKEDKTYHSNLNKETFGDFYIEKKNYNHKYNYNNYYRGGRGYRGGGYKNYNSKFSNTSYQHSQHAYPSQPYYYYNQNYGGNPGIPGTNGGNVGGNGGGFQGHNNYQGKHYTTGYYTKTYTPKQT